MKAATIAEVVCRPITCKIFATNRYPASSAPARGDGSFPSVVEEVGLEEVGLMKIFLAAFNVTAATA
jgi:hypothetical protein